MSEHTVAGFLVHQILQGASRQGYDTEAILRRAGIAPASLSGRHAGVTRTQYAALMRTVKRVMRDEFWGLADRPLPPGTFANLCARLIQCGDLGEALRTGFAFMRLFISDPVARLMVSDDTATVKVRHRHAPAHGTYDFCVATYVFETMQLAAWLTGREIPLRKVLFHFKAPQPVVVEARLLGDKPHYNAAQSQLVIDAEALRYPVVRDVNALALFLGQAPGNLVLRLRRQGGLSEIVRLQLKGHFPHALPDVHACAASLGYSTQTLRRRLRAEGQGYQRIVNAVRRDAALQLLRRSDIPLDEIAMRLGFSESSTFHRAFKKWMGVSPGVWRAQNAHNT